MALDGSLGTNGAVFPWLREHVPGYSGLRVPARFSMLVGLSLAILSGYRRRASSNRVAAVSRRDHRCDGGSDPRRRMPYLELEPCVVGAAGDLRRPSADDPEARARRISDAGRTKILLADTRYLYFSTFHWHKMVNGNSGFSPPSYRELLKRERDFPRPPRGLSAERGVDYLALHGAFTNPTRYRRTAELLEARGDLELVAVAPWEGSESRLYRLRR